MADLEPEKRELSRHLRGAAGRSTDDEQGARRRQLEGGPAREPRRAPACEGASRENAHQPVACRPVAIAARKQDAAGRDGGDGSAGSARRRSREEPRRAPPGATGRSAPRARRREEREGGLGYK
eukprot:scaffold173875_cov31-Tisochrysis_lutea.AAC.2